jgi:hypothetical protein
VFKTRPHPQSTPNQQFLTVREYFGSPLVLSGFIRMAEYLVASAAQKVYLSFMWIDLCGPIKVSHGPLDMVQFEVQLRSF